MGCKECGKPKCNGKCGCNSPKVLQINNPAEYITFHKVSIPAAMGDSTTNPPKIGAYRNALVYYEADHTSWLYSTDGIPTLVTGEKGETGDVGPQGPAGTITVGTTTTGEAGSDAEVENVGTPENAILNFTIPRGEQGVQGETGPQGYMNEQDVRDVVDTIVPEGFFDDESTVSDCGTNFELENLVGGAPVSLRLEGDTFQQSYTGKNLFDIDQYSNAYLRGGGAGVSLGKIDSRTLRATNKVKQSNNFCGIPVPNYTELLGQTVTVSGSITRHNVPNTRIVFAWDTNGVSIFGQNLALSQNGTFSLTQSIPASAPSGTIGLLVVIYANGEGTLGEANSYVDWSDVQLEVGSSATSYEPYVGRAESPSPDYPQQIQTVTGTQTISINGTDYPINLGSIELCKLGDYQDYIWKDGEDWKLHKATDKASFSTLNWAMQQTETTTSYRIRTSSLASLIKTPADNNTPTVAVCNYYLAKSAGQTYNREQGMSVQTTGSAVLPGWVTIYDNTYNTSSSLDSWKATSAYTSGQLYYPLATATDTTITEQTLIAQLEAIRLQDGTNTISVTSEGLVGNICLSGYASNWEGTIGSIEQNLSERVYSVDTTAEMSLREFSAGEQVHTLGYWEKGDGGGGHYYIVDAAGETSDGGSVIALPNGLVAKLDIKNDVINVKQFGAKGDGVTEDSVAIQNALKYNGNNKSIVKFVKGETYLVDNNFYIYSNTTVDLNGSTVKCVDGGPFNTSYNRVQFMNNLESMTLPGYGALRNFVFRDGTLNGNTGGFAFPLFHAQDCLFENINFNNCFVSTHVFDLGGCKNITIKNCNFIGNLLSTEANNYREVIQPDYATYGGLPYWGDDESFAFDALPTDGLTVDGCVFKKNDGDTYYLNAVGTHSANTDPHNNIVVKNCEFYDCQYSCIRLLKANNIVVENNTFYNIRTDRTTDNFAINISNEGSSGIVALHGVAIRGNKYISTQPTTDQIFIKVFGRDDYLTTDVIIENNVYNGTAVSEADYVGNDCVQIQNTDGLVFRNNVINRAKAIVFTGNKVAKNLRFVDNVCYNCLRGVRSNASMADASSNAYPGNFIWANNAWTNPIGSIDTSGTSWIVGLDEDVSFDDASSTYHKLPAVLKSGIDLYQGASGGTFRIPSYIKRVRVTGTMSATTSNGGIVEYTEIHTYNRPTSESLSFKNDHNVDTASATKSLDMGEGVLEDKSVGWPYYSSTEALLWRDGIFEIQFGIRCTGEVTVNAANTRFIIEAY